MENRNWPYDLDCSKVRRILLVHRDAPEGEWVDIVQGSFAFHMRGLGGVSSSEPGDLSCVFEYQEAKPSEFPIVHTWGLSCLVGVEVVEPDDTLGPHGSPWFRVRQYMLPAPQKAAKPKRRHSQ